MKLSLQLFSRLPGLAPLFLVAISFAARAELPPAVYDEMKREAPEVFLVRIEEAAKNKIVVRGKQQQFTYEAKVLRVFRTRSRIRPGGAIVIQSQHHIFGPGEVGPSNPRKLKEKDTVLAYLVKGGKVDEFRTAAGGHSFEESTPQRVAGLIKVPANPVEAEPVPSVRVDPVRLRPDFPPPEPDDEPAIIGGPVMPSGGAMPMPMMNEMPGRFEIIPVQLTQAGKPVPAVIKLDTQTGEVWQLKLTESKFFHNGQPQARSSLSFESIFEGRPPRPDRGRVAPGRPAIGREEETVPDDIDVEVIPERPRRLRPRPIPVQPPRRGPERGSSRESTPGDATVTVVRQRVDVAENRPPALKDKANSTKVTGTVITPKVVKDIAGLMLELRLYEYDPFLADAAADLVGKLRVKNLAHKKGKETKTQFILAEDGSIQPRRSYYLTCFVIDAKGKRYLMGEKDGKRGLCKVLTGGNPNKVNLILRDLRK